MYLRKIAIISQSNNLNNSFSNVNSMLKTNSKSVFNILCFFFPSEEMPFTEDEKAFKYQTKNFEFFFTCCQNLKSFERELVKQFDYRKI